VIKYGLDKNANGIQDSDEEGVAGAKIKVIPLKDASGNVHLADIDGSLFSDKIYKSDSNGLYKICGLVPGVYKLSFQKDADANGAPFFSTKENVGDDSNDSDIPEFLDVTTNALETITEYTLISGDFNTTVDAGFTQEICLGSYVWEDTNANGIQEDSEAPIEGMGVRLYMKDATGQWVVAKSVTGADIEKIDTNASGKYEFCHIIPARDYKIVFDETTDSSGLKYYPTYKNIGDDTTLDSDVDNNKEIVVVKPILDDMTQDAGFFKPACVGDLVWEDMNANGIQDEEDRGLAGAKVEIRKKDSIERLLDVDGNVVNSQITKDDGLYHFCNLRPDSYEIKVTTTDGYYVTRDNKGDSDKDSNIAPSLTPVSGTTDVTLTSGENNTTVDTGFFKDACVENYMWEDENANGVQELEEHGLGGVKVTIVALKDSNGYINNTDLDKRLLSQEEQTDDNGTYKHCKLIPGHYQILVTTPDGYVITRNHTVEDDKDSNVGEFLDGGQQPLPPVVLDSGETNSSLDGGFFKPGCLGDYVWIDKNADGIQDPDEEPLDGMDVKLIPTTDEFGFINKTDVNGTIIEDSITKTDEKGHYEFCNLIPGSYKVAFRSSEPLYTTKKIDSEDVQSSAVEEFVNLQNTWVETDAISLNSGNDFKSIVLDAGVINNMCIGDRVWYDKNENGIQDPNEEGVVDVGVTLLDANGNIAKDMEGMEIKSIKTDKNGEYMFCKLTPKNSYQIKFTLPNGYYVTKHIEGDYEINSDADTEPKILVKELNIVEDSQYNGVKNDNPGDFTNDVGISCDFSVNDVEKEVKASAFNFISILFTISTLILLSLLNFKKEEG